MGQAAGDWNDALIDENNIAPMQSMLDLKGMDKNDNVSVAYVDGKLTFSAKNYYSDASSTWGDEVSMNSEQMFEALPSKDLANDERILKDNKTFSLQGTTDAKNGQPNYFDEDGVTFGEEKANFVGQIKNEKQFQDIASRRMEGINAPSFTQALRSRIDIQLSVLDNMFYDENGQRVDLGSVFAGLDKDNSGFINQDDLAGLTGEDLEAFKNNHEQMLDALTNINNPAFDMETSKDLLGDYYTNLKKQAYDVTYNKQIKSQDTDATWKQLGFSDYGKYEDWLKNRDKIETDYENRNVEFDLFTKEGGQDISTKTKTTSDELINKDNQLNNLMNSGQSSFDTENYVDIFGSRVGYFPGKGFAPVRKATRNDIGNKEFEKALGRPVKVCEIVRVEPGSDVAYWKTPQDLFKNYIIPTTYSKKVYKKGDEMPMKDGRTAIYTGTQWIVKK